MPGNSPTFRREKRKYANRGYMVDRDTTTTTCKRSCFDDDATAAASTELNGRLAKLQDELEALRKKSALLEAVASTNKKYKSLDELKLTEVSITEMTTFFDEKFEEAKSGLTSAVKMIGDFAVGKSAGAKIKTLEQLMLIKERVAQLLLRTRNGWLYRFQPHDPFPYPAFTSLTTVKDSKTTNDSRVKEMNTALMGKHYLALYRECDSLISQLQNDQEMQTATIDQWVINKLDTMQHNSFFPLHVQHAADSNIISLGNVESTAVIQPVQPHATATLNQSSETILDAVTTKVPGNASLLRDKSGTDDQVDQTGRLTESEWQDVLSNRKQRMLKQQVRNTNSQNVYYNQQAPANTGISCGLPRPYTPRPYTSRPYITPFHNNAARPRNPPMPLTGQSPFVNTGMRNNINNNYSFRTGYGPFPSNNGNGYGYPSRPPINYGGYGQQNLRYNANPPNGFNRN